MLFVYQTFFFRKSIILQFLILNFIKIVFVYFYVLNEASKTLANS